jgi:hypothetical protein
MQHHLHTLQEQKTTQQHNSRWQQCVPNQDQGMQHGSAVTDVR